jgi:hypothetical protein
MSKNSIFILKSFTIFQPVGTYVLIATGCRNLGRRKTAGHEVGLFIKPLLCIKDFSPDNAEFISKI